MSDRPFHHGSLRAVLLDRAELVLRERGIDALSLRELAREAGVSHGAPRSHFIDRNALLDALAARGFTRLAEAISAAASREADDYAGCLRAAARAYVDFAVSDAALLDLMFAAKIDGPSDAVRSAAEGLFVTVSDLIKAGAAAGAFGGRDVGRLTLLVSATMRGISAHVASRSITTAQGDTLIDDAIALFLAGPAGKPSTTS